MSAVSRGVDAGARSHAETLSEGRGRTSRSFSSFREKSLHDNLSKKHMVPSNRPVLSQNMAVRSTRNRYSDVVMPIIVIIIIVDK